MLDWMFSHLGLLHGAVDDVIRVIFEHEPSRLRATFLRSSSSARLLRDLCRRRELLLLTWSSIHKRINIRLLKYFLQLILLE